MAIEEKLKQELVKIKESGRIGKEIEPYELSIKMLDNIGSLDSILRDDLILKIFYHLIEGARLSYEQMKNILKICLSKEHLFCGLGKVNDDTVFNRTFSMLIIEAIICANNKAEKPFLCKSEVKKVFKIIVDYLRKEKDFRGYVEGKGWAHSIAHASDTLCSLAESKHLDCKELKEILNMIRGAICISDYTYINEEDERLVNAFMTVYNRNIIEIDEFIDWINSFNEIKGNGRYPDEEHLRENRKVFLRSLYFRTKKFHLDVSIFKSIENALNNLPAYY
jgi:hypothetical protein